MECPDCKSNDVVSKGYREGTNFRRFICKNCKRNFTEEHTTIPLKSNDEITITEKPKTTTIQISIEVLDKIKSLKLCPQESNNNVLLRVLIP